jgi:hypothetical protein
MSEIHAIFHRKLHTLGKIAHIRPAATEPVTVRLRPLHPLTGARMILAQWQSTLSKSICVLICDGGVIGASIACFLSHCEVETTVIERTGLAGTTSGKSV